MVRTEGQRQLLELRNQGVMQKEIARRVGRATGTVSFWFTGRRLPDVVSGSRLQNEYGISVGTWDEKPRRKNGKRQ